jgi:hypothetical protein
MSGKAYIKGKETAADLTALLAAVADLEDKLGSIIIFRGTTTADGAAGGLNLICSDIATEPDYDGSTVVIMSGVYTGQFSSIDGLTTGGIITAKTHFDGQIITGIEFAILAYESPSALIGAVKAELDDPAFGLAAIKATIRDMVDGVHVDSTLGTAGTTFPLGTAQNPVNNLTDATAIANLLKTRYIYIHGNANYNMPVNLLQEFVFIGDKHYSQRIDMNGRNMHGSVFMHLQLAGMNGDATSIVAVDCTIGSSIFSGSVFNCSILDAAQIVSSSLIGYNLIFGTGSIISGASAGPHVYELFNCSGSFSIENLADVGDSITIYGDSLFLDIINTTWSGVINLYGTISRLVNSTAGTVVNDYTDSAKLDNLALVPTVGSTSANWNTGHATSGLAGADLVVINVAAAVKKIQSVMLNVLNMTAAANIMVRLYQAINGVDTCVYSTVFVKGTDPDGIWVVNGVTAIHSALRIEVYSSAADDGKAVDWDYTLGG